MELNENNRPLTEVPANEMPETSVQPVADASQARYPQRKSKEEVIERLKEIIADNCNADKQEIDLLKQTFYKLHKAEQDAAQKDFVNNGGKAEAFIPKPDSLEGEFKSLMGSIKEKRNELMAAQEEEKEKNLARKLEILEKIKNIAESPEEAGKHTMNSNSSSRNGMTSNWFPLRKSTNSERTTSSIQKSFMTC